MATRGGSRRDSEELDGVDLEDRDPRGPVKRAARTRSKRARQYRGARLLRALRWVGLGTLALTIAGTVSVIVLFVYYGSDSHLPRIEHVSDYHPKQLVRVLDHDGKPIGE